VPAHSIAGIGHSQRLEQWSFADGENLRENEALKEVRQKIENRKRYCGPHD
jgi:hypothetical protein